MVNFLTIAICLTQTATFKFEGGSDYELCKSISIAIKQPVVLLAQSNRIWSKFSIEYEDVKGFKRLLKTKLGLDQINESTCGLASQSYTPSVFLFNNGFHEKELETCKPSVSNKAGVISITTENGPAAFGSFLSVLTKKKVTWHWFFNDMKLIGYVKNASEDTVLGTIAEAVGAKVVEDDSQNKLEIDPVRYRDRGVALMNGLATKRGIMACDFMFTGACLKELSDKQIDELLKSPGTELEVTISAKDVLAAAQNRLETRFPVKSDNIRRDRSMIMIWEQLSPKMDWSKPPHAIIRHGSVYGLKYFGKPEEPCEWVF